MYNDVSKVIKTLRAGGIAVVPTDTLYGIVARYDDKKAIERIYKVKGRDDGKPLIVLVASLNDLNLFNVKLTAEQKKFLESNWPGKVSVMFPVNKSKFTHIHRGTGSIAFRMIGKRNPNVFKIIKSVGPIVAPSANPQSKEPGKTVWECRKYFGDTVDAYLCSGTKKGSASTIVDYTSQTPKILRQGDVVIKNL